MNAGSDQNWRFAAALVRALGGRVHLASTLDGPLGIAVVLRVELLCGLPTLPQLEVEDDRVTVTDGRIAGPPGAGLLD